jgi:hypothetical protein
MTFWATELLDPESKNASIRMIFIAGCFDDGIPYGKHQPCFVGR